MIKTRYKGINAHSREELQRIVEHYTSHEFPIILQIFRRASPALDCLAVENITESIKKEARELSNMMRVQMVHFCEDIVSTAGKYCNMSDALFEYHQEMGKDLKRFTDEENEKIYSPEVIEEFKEIMEKMDALRKKLDTPPI